ncbi:MAG: hypothetical protein AB7I33_12960 [Gemmatimonadales bacterium]
MDSIGIAWPRLMAAGLAAGAWVFVSGIIMARLFGYREMSASFSRIGLQVPMGTGPFVTHTLVRLGLGITIVALFVIFARVMPASRAVWWAAASAWLLGNFFPYLVVTEWGLFPWGLAWKFWGWGVGEFLIAAAIGRMIYRA